MLPSPFGRRVGPDGTPFPFFCTRPLSPFRGGALQDVLGTVQVTRSARLNASLGRSPLFAGVALSLSQGLP